MAARPPEGGVRDGERHRAGVDRESPSCGGHQATGRVGDLDIDVDVVGSCPLELDVQVDLTGAVDGDHGSHRGEAGRRPRLDADRLPDARRDEHGPPVPAEVAGHLADRVVGVGVADERARPEPILRLLGVGEGRGEVDREVAALRLLAVAVTVVVAVAVTVAIPVPRAQDGSEVEAVRPVLVARAADLGAVEGERRDGVEPLGDEVDSLVAGSVDLDVDVVADVGAADPLDALLVQVDVGVGDEPGGQKIGVHGARHGRRHGARGAVREEAVGDRAVDQRQAPAVCQGGADHR